MKFDKREESLRNAQDHCDKLLKDEGIIIQPYMRYVETVGEISCIYFGNKLSNIV